LKKIIQRKEDDFMTQANLEKIAADERKAYFKAWRAANKDKVKQHNANYWKKRVEKKLEKEGEEYDANNKQ